MSVIPLKDRLTVAAMAVLIALCVFSTWAWLSVRTNTKRLDVIEELYQRSSDRWNGSDMRHWTEELLRLNPDLKLPPIPDK